MITELTKRELVDQIMADLTVEARAFGIVGIDNAQAVRHYLMHCKKSDLVLHLFAKPGDKGRIVEVNV